MTVTLVDAHYDTSTAARAACGLAESWEADSTLEEHELRIGRVEPYEPGNFYRRELPCLLAVLGLLSAPPDVIVIDGYVWLSSRERPGLGARLYEVLERRIAIVGIAKTAFLGADSSPVVSTVYRGGSLRPLYVTAAGMSLDVAAENVRGMAGRHRIPELVRRVDRLAREAGASG